MDTFLIILGGFMLAAIRACFLIMRKDSQLLEPLPGPLHKVIIALVMVLLSKWRAKSQQKFTDSELERRKREPPSVTLNASGDSGQSEKHFNDSFFFYGSERDNSACFSARIGHTGKRGCQVTPWLAFRINELDYTTPDGFTEDSVPGESDDEISASSGENKLECVCLKPMQKWRLNYYGNVKEISSGKIKKCTIDMTLDLHKNAFFYTTHWDPLTTAKAMSVMPWSREFFQNLRSEHQFRYEQGGRWTGCIYLDDKKYESRDIFGFRDHSFGKRNWTFMIRYIWLGTVCLLDPLEIQGQKYTSITGTSVEYGTTFKHLVAGGLIGDEGVLSLTGMTNMGKVAPVWFYSNSARPAESQGGNIPDRIFFQLSIQSGHVIDVEVQRHLWKHSFLMQKDTFDVHEGQSLYTFTLRDKHGGEILSRVQGIGLLEFGHKLN